MGIASRYSESDLINILKEYYGKYGKSPTGKELKNPTSEVFYNKFNTTSWNSILRIAGLPINWEAWNEQDAVDSYKKLFLKLNRIPTLNEINNSGFTPSYDWIYHHGFKVKDFFYSLGLIEKPLTIEERINISLNELEKLAHKLGRCPSVNEFDSLSHKGLKRRALEKNLKMKYNDICRKYISDYKLNMNKDILINEGEVINSINKMYQEFGYILSYEEYKKLDYSYSYDTIERIFHKTYGQLVEFLGYKMYGTTTLQKTEEEMLDDFSRLFNKLQRIPYTEEFTEDNEISSYGTYIKHFKNLKNVCDLLDIDWDTFNCRKSGGKILFDKNNEMCRSLGELKITNWLIDNNIKFQKEVLYADIIDKDKNRKQSRRFDWVIEFNNKKYYVEYLGLYELNCKSIVSKVYIKKARKKIKDLYKAGIINQCIFIFPNDIKSNTSIRLKEKLESFSCKKLILI